MSSGRGSESKAKQQYGNLSHVQPHRTFTDFNPSSNQISTHIKAFEGINSTIPQQRRNQQTLYSQQQEYDTSGIKIPTTSDLKSGNNDKFQYFQPQRSQSTSRGYQPLTQQQARDSNFRQNNNMSTQLSSGQSQLQDSHQNRVTRSNNFYQPSSDRNDYTKHNTNIQNSDYRQPQQDQSEIVKKKIYPKSNSFMHASDKIDDQRKLSNYRDQNIQLDSSANPSGNKSHYSYLRDDLGSSIGSKQTPTNQRNQNFNVSKFTYPKQQTEYAKQRTNNNYQSQNIKDFASRNQITDTLQSYDNQSPNKPIEGQGSEQVNLTNDMEQIIMNLHNKMKNLESKYLDLANFYKKELVTSQQQNQKSQKSSSQTDRYFNQPQPRFNNQEENNAQNDIKSRSPFRSDSQNAYNDLQMDQKLEKNLISDLLKEKKELENELQNMIQIQSRYLEEEEKMEFRLEAIQQENQLLKDQVKLKEKPRISQETIDEITSSVQRIIDDFEKELLDFINANYQSFTEKDVLGLFLGLKQQVQKIIDTILRQQNLYQSQNYQKADEQIMIEQRKLIENYKKDMSEYEINHEYIQQNLKKTLFELQNSHDTSKLDLKKINLSLSQIHKTQSELNNTQGGFNSGRQDSKSRMKQQNYDKSGDNSNIYSDSRSPSSGQSQYQNQRLFNTLSNQIQILSQNVTGLNQKFEETDKILNRVQSIEQDHKQNLVFLKSSFDQFSNYFDENLNPPFSERSSKPPFELQNSRLDQQQLLLLNNQLQDELSNATRELSRLRDENTNLLSKYGTLEIQQEIQSPTFRKLNRNSHDVVINQKQVQSLTAPDRMYESQQNRLDELSQLQQNLSQIEMENRGLIQQIKTLNRTVNEKTEEIKRLSIELNQVSSNNFNNDPYQDQVGFLQHQFNSQTYQLKNLMKLTYKFLSSMKKLQKAVHRKEADVSREKNDFEMTRKDLETLLKQLKKEFDNQKANNIIEVQNRNMHDNINQHQIQVQQRSSSNSGGNRASSQGGISNDDNPVIQTQINKYQNKVPHTFSARESVQPFQIKNNKTQSQPQQPLPYYQQRNSSNNKMTNSQNNNLMKSIGNQSLAVSSIYNEGNIKPQVFNIMGHNQDDIISVERSPIINLRSRPQMPPTEGFRSIDGRKTSAFNDFNNKNNSLIQSLDKVPSNRSPSVNQDFNRTKFSLEEPVKSPTYLNLKSEIEVLKQEIQDLVHDREGLFQQLAQSEREKDLLIMDKQQLEKQIDKDYKKTEVLRRQLQDLEIERDSIVQELMRSKLSLQQSPSQHHPLDTTNLQIQLDSSSQKIQQLEHQLEIIEKINQEYKRTIGYLEESAEVAKQTITELRDSLTQKELEIEEVLGNGQYAKKQFRRFEIEEIKQQILFEIEHEDRLKGIEAMIQTKEKAIIKIHKTLNNKQSLIANQQNQEGQNLQSQVEELQQQVQELQGQNEQMTQIQQDNKTKTKQINQLQQQLQTQKQIHEQQISQIQKNQQTSQLSASELQNQIQELQDSHDQQLQQLRQSHEAHLTKLKANHEKLLNKIKSDHDQQLAILQQNEQENLEYQLNNQREESERQLKEVQLKAKKEADQKIKEIQDKHQQEVQKLKEQYDDRLQLFLKDDNSSQELNEKLDQLNSQIIKDKTKWDTDKSRLESQIRDLREQMRKQIQIKDQEIQQLQDEVEQEKQQIQDAHKQTEKEARDQITQKDQQIKQLRQENQKLLQEKDQHVQQVSTEYESHIEQIQQDLQQQIDDLSVQVNKLQKEKEQLVQQHQRDVYNLKQLQSKINDQQNSIIRQKDEQIEALNNQVQDLDALNQQLQNDGSNSHALLQQQVDHQKNQLKLKDSTIDNLKNQIKESNSKIQQLEEKLENVENSLEQANLNLNQLQDKAEAASRQKATLEQQLENQIKTLKDKIKEADTQKIELRAQILTLQTQSEEDQSEFEKRESEMQLKIKQLENEIKNKNKQGQEKDEQIKKQQIKISQSENESIMTKSIKQSLQQQLEKIQQEMQDAQFQTQLSNQSLQDSQQLVTKLQHDNSTLNTQNQSLIKEKRNLEHQVTQLHQEIDLHQKDHASAIEKKDKQIQDLQLEKERAQDQLSQIVTSTQVEKQSVEERLQTQLSQTIKDLKQKEKDIIRITNENEKLTQKLQEALSNELQAKQIMVELQSENQQQQFDNENLQEQINKKQQTLEQNKNLITMLKTELQKAIEKQKSQDEESNIKKQELEQNLNSQNEDLQKQLQQLKKQSDEKINQLKSQLLAKEKDLKAKNALIEEANKVIEEFNDEKHSLKAKFKHLIQLLDNVKDESLYHEDDLIDLDECLQRFEREFLRNKQQIQAHIQLLNKDIASLKDQLKSSQQELAQIQLKSQELNNQLAQALTKVDNNDQEFRKQLDIASRKIQNYKEKVMEKQKQINNLEAEKREIQQSRQEKTAGGNTSLRDVELLQRLQKAENELQIYRLSHQNKRNITPDDSMDDKSIRVDLQRINQIEEQLLSLRKQLFSAKDQVISTLSETFAKKLKDLQRIYQQENILKSKLSELKTDQQIQGLNNNLKAMKQIKFNNKKLLLVQALSNNECYILDETKLSEVALSYLKQYIPTNDKELDQTNLVIDENQQKILDQLEEQLKEIREERQELQQELSIYKNKMISGNGFEDLKDLKLIELEDDVGHLQAENQEVRLKMKDLVQQNLLLKSRLIEVNEMIKDLTGKQGNGDPANQKLLKLLDENESLKQQLSQYQSQNQQKFSSLNMRSNPRMSNFNNNEDDDIEDGSFLQGIQVAGNVNHSIQENDNQNLFDQSSLYGVIQGIEGDGAQSNQQQEQSQKMKVLQQQVDELTIKNKQLQADLSKKEQSLSKEDQGIISHVKGTLIQFLKNCPLTDKNNEILLEVVLSVMEFSKEEMMDLNDVRRRARSSSVSNTNETEDDVKAKAKKGIFNMFKKKEKDNSLVRRPQDQGVSPIRPVQRR